ncbi:Nn.00g031310.m01.CDS01 [Neocucurbitaria sp. VM-36]
MDVYSRQPRKWTLEEDEKLREEVEAQLMSGDVKDWCRIAAKLPGRTNKDCRKRWHNSVAGGLKKGQWSKSEDQLLSKGVEQYGQRWTLVANCVTSRSADQCAKRWQQSLDPDLDRSEWRDSEDKILIEATQRLGRHWKDIQREHFPGRSKNCIKNRYTVLVRRYQNQGINLPSAPSSPSESSTPTPVPYYPDDDDEHISSTPSMYSNLLSTHSQATSSEIHSSWTRLDNDAYSTWSSPQDYNMPIAVTGPEAYHTTTPMSQYGYTQPQTLSSNVPAASTTWNWATSTNPSSSMYAKSPATSPSVPNPSFYGYSNYPVAQQPIGGRYPTYSPSPAQASYTAMPNQALTSVPRPITTTEHQSYGSSVTYADPRHPHNHMYRF